MTRIEQHGFRGYCVHQPFNGLRMPVPAQNILLRDYAGRHGLMFKLSVNELDFPNCDVQLFGLLAANLGGDPGFSVPPAACP